MNLFDLTRNICSEFGGANIQCNGLGPGNDLVSSTALTAAGAHMVLFTTGRGTPFGAPAPTMKIATNTPPGHQEARLD